MIVKVIDFILKIVAIAALGLLAFSFLQTFSEGRSDYAFRGLAFKGHFIEGSRR